MIQPKAVETSREAFTLEEISRVSLMAGIASPHWNALEKQLAQELLKLQARLSPEAIPDEVKRKEILSI